VSQTGEGERNGAGETVIGEVENREVPPGRKVR